MNISRVWAVHFSPTGATRSVTLAVALGAAGVLDLPVTEYELARPTLREKELFFSPEDLVIVGTPTYAGRVPNKLRPALRTCLKGAATPAAAVVTFGNRAYENSLAELCALLEGDGLCPVGGGAFVTRHSFGEVLAPGRPDGDDLAAARAFGAAVAQKLVKAEQMPVGIKVPGNPEAPYYIPLGADGEPARFLKAKPRTRPERCAACGVCARLCPMGAISLTDPSDVHGTCIKCQSCIRRCPEGAKHFDDPAFLSHKAMLEQTCTARKGNECYL